ncbi:sperm-tail PG-rich repeat-containing protein 2-like [Babylonia areolata]|uniref:sperm-tail PG-rich repeat-containing protein 2-like n=1 Tax=Babylonia areolata TaxID=304850 RepID=UPI003FD17715
MYDRASRQLLWNSGCTPKDVGPGTYEVAEFEGVARGRGKGRAPFLTMSDRQACSQLLNDEMTSTPGPGAYDPDAVQPRVLGGSTLDTRERRFKHRVADTPGPGYYEVERQTTDWADHTHITSKDMVESAASGKVEARSTRQYRGIHFGKMAPRKIDMLGYRSENPGPGTYNPQGAGGGGGGGGDRWAEDRNPTTAGAPAAPTKPPVYKIPRYCDAIVRETEKLNYPGPGRYQIRSQFDPQPPRITPLEGLEMEKPPFLSQAKRFNPLKTYVPAPGTYNDPRTALTCLNKLRGLTQSPFGKTSPRFQKGQRNKIAPGPGTYGCPRGMGMESLRKAHYESTRKGVFGTTASRSLPGQAQEARNQPGPAHYTPKPRPFQSRYIQPSSIFSSHTDRLTKPPGLVETFTALCSVEVHLDPSRSS